MSTTAPGCQPPVFTPVPVRARRDGWTPRRQAAFIFALCESRCVDEACRRVGLSQQSAYKLRARRDAASFRAAWEAVLAMRALPDDFTGRAVGGTARPITYGGCTVGERRRYDNRLGRFLMQAHAPDRRRNDVSADVARGWPTSAAVRSGHCPRRAGP